MGTFVPVADPPLKKWVPGHVRLHEDGRVEVALMPRSVLDEDEPPVDPMTTEVLAGATEAGNILLTHLDRAETSSVVDGGPHPTIVRFWSREVLTGVSFADVSNRDVVEAQVAYLGLREWALDDPLVEEFGPSYRAAIGELPRHERRIGNSCTISFRREWRLSGPPDERILTLPLLVGVRVTKRTSLDELLAILHYLHALLSLAHRHEVKATDGRVRLTKEEKWAGMWESSLMSPSPERRNAFAHFSLDSVGGIDAVREWVKLCRKHSRAVQPLVSHRLFDNQTPESRLLSTAAAIEYWVKVCDNRHQEWAGNRKGEALTRSVLRVLHPAFDTFVGDGERWADEFWKRYTDLKHDFTQEFEANETHHLEVAGRWALMAMLLDECAGSQQVSEHLFSRSLLRDGAGIRRGLGWQASQDRNA